MALFIVVLLNINSYAAVGANDGSAFVTKAEFDALVNTFNEQMDTYQSGINAKIDGSIANYLGGLSSYKTVKQSNMIEQIVAFTEHSDLVWLPSFSPKDTVEANTLQKSGSLSWSNMNEGNKYMLKINLGDCWSTKPASGNETKGKYYRVSNNYMLKSYWTDVYINHICNGSNGSNNGMAYGSTVRYNSPAYTLFQSFTEYGTKQEVFGITVTGWKSDGSSMGFDIYGTSTLDRKNTVSENFDDNIMYGTVTSKDIWVITDENLEKVKKNVDCPSTQYYIFTGGSVTKQGSHTGSGWTSSTADKIVNYKPNATKISSTNLCNDAVKRVSKGSGKVFAGVPFVTCTDDGDLKFKMKWTTSTARTTDYVQFGFKKGEFNNNAEDCKIADTLDTNLTNNVAGHNKEIDVEIKGLKKDDVIWIKGIPLQADAKGYLTLSDLQMIVD